MTKWYVNVGISDKSVFGQSLVVLVKSDHVLLRDNKTRRCSIFTQMEAFYRKINLLCGQLNKDLRRIQAKCCLECSNVQSGNLDA